MSLFKNDAMTRSINMKVVEDCAKIKILVDGLRITDHRIVLTIGSWDMLHIGHCRYLLEARKQGDILLVGVDSDRAIKSYKGENRPIIPENERLEMLAYQAFVDVITLVDDVDENGAWQFGLLELVKPDVFVAVEDSYDDKQLTAIRQYAARVVVFPRQAEETSTSNIIQKVVKKNPELVQKMMKSGEMKSGGSK